MVTRSLLNIKVIKLKEPISLDIEGIDPPAHLPERNWINVNGREEHEAILKNHQRMISLGLDPIYETIVYLKRWGGWLNALGK